jgi:hypothetical protein
MDLSKATDAELIDELRRRGRNPRCKCSRWQTYLGTYDQRGYTWRCRGCLKAVDECRCR